MGFWLKHLRITAEAYPPHGAAARPVICMCNASVYSETCSMLQSASRLSHL